jgi:protein required for attachment to host cells
VQAGETKSVVIAAPPKALGVLRRVYTQGLRNALRAEIDKDYVKMPLHEIEKHLAA